MVCANYHGISLLNLGYKVLSSVIFDHLVPFVKSSMGVYQCGFRSSKSTTDQIFTQRQILERTTEFGIGTHHLFIDYKAAYDSIRREQLYDSIRDMNILENQLEWLKQYCLMLHQGETNLSKPLTSHNGLRQGDALACLLFNTALEKVIREANLKLETSFVSQYKYWDMLTIWI
jgi:sorting nexin-29